MEPLLIPLLTALLSAPECLPPVSPEPTSLVIRGVTAIDCTGGPARPEVTVVITGVCIVGLDGTNDVVVPEGARVIDGHGNYLIPGLWDMKSTGTTRTTSRSTSPAASRASGR